MKRGFVIGIVSFIVIGVGCVVSGHQMDLDGVMIPEYLGVTPLAVTYNPSWPSSWYTCEHSSELKVLKEAVGLLLKESVERYQPAELKCSVMPSVLASAEAIGYNICYELRDENGEWQLVSRDQYKAFEKEVDECRDSRIARMNELIELLEAPDDGL